MSERLRYTVKRRGKLFWQPSRQMRELGFAPMALGEDSEASRAKARALAAEWDRAKAERGRATAYPPGTFGAYWDRLRFAAKDQPSAWWARKKPRTREDYERAWAHIDAWSPGAGRPTLSRTVVTAITPDLCEQFYAHLEAACSSRERWRTIKVLKVLLADMVVRLRLGYASPAERLTNPQPAGRAKIWLAAEVEDLAAVAAIAGFEGMSLAIETAWETMFSPVDVRTLRPSQLKRDADGWYLTGRRAKTGVEFFAAISDGLAARIQAYLERQRRAEVDDTPIFRTRIFRAGPGRRPRAVPYATKDLFAKDFRLVRAIAFPGDERQLLDIRRSANVEADAAGADKKTMGELLANGLADSRFLEATYTPPTVAKAREVAAQRLEGRARLAGEVARLRAANRD